MLPLEEVVRRAKLEVATVKGSELIGAHRIDAEAYQREVLNAYIALARLPHVQLGEVAFITDGQHGYHVIDETSEIKHLTAQCIRNGYVDASNADRISAEMHARNQRSACESGDVVLSTAGTIGSAGVVTADVLPANMDQDLARIKIYDQHQLNPWYVATFLSSWFGRLQTGRESTGQVQQHLALEKVRQLRIPLLDDQDAIARKAHRAFELFRESEALYAQAQVLLTAELGLDRLDLSEGLYSVRRSSEALQARRIDAEYYKPRYQRLLEHIQKTGQGIRLGDWVAEPIKRGVQPEYVGDGDTVVINSQHVGKTHIVLDDNRFTSRGLYQVGANQRAIVRQYDVLLNSTGYITIGRCQTLLDDVQAVIDGHISIIRPKEGLDPVYLAVYLNALPGQLQTERGWTGSSGQIELRAEVISDFVIWKAPAHTQQQIRGLIEQSHQARREAKRLLAEARAEVERMIEAA